MKKKIVCLLIAAGLLIPAAVSAAYCFGDVNGDGVLNSFDLAILKKELAGGTQEMAADLDNDGQLTQSDVEQMQDFLLGRTDNFDAPISAASVRLTGTGSVTAASGQRTDDAFLSAQMDFAAELFRNTAQRDENTLVSPLSVMLALSMTANGADGDTLAEMEAVLGDGMSMDDLNEYLAYYMNHLSCSDACKLYIADSIWYRDTESLEVFDDFVDTNMAYYNAEIYRAPFDSQTVRDVNLWVEQNTDGMIPELVKEFSPDLMMMLINAITFDAEWQEQYEEVQVRDGSFTAADGTEQTAEMMHSEESLYYDFGNAAGFGKNYAGGSYRFVAILPEEGMDVSEWIAQMDSAALLETLENPEYHTVAAQMPKFSYETDLTLNETLDAMGMPTAFQAEEADFSAMGLVNGEPSLYISSVIHKTRISVDNAGTKAAAVTAVMMNECEDYDPEEPYYVTLDRPFVYLIVDTGTNLPIFMGTVQSMSE